MSLRDERILILETDTAANSLSDPTTVNGQTYFLVNTGTVTCVWSSTGATPFTEGGVNVATISVLRGQFKVIQSDGVHWLVAPDVPLIPIVSTPARVFNAAFTPNAIRPTLGIYTVEIACSGLLLAGQTGRVELLADNGVPATIRGSLRNSFLPAGALVLGGGSTQRAQLTFLFPAGWQGRINTINEVGTPTFTFVQQTEVTI